MTVHRVGLMGGTFDPIHNAHLFIAEDARVRFELDTVLFIPNGSPPHKSGRAVASGTHRLEMAKLAVAANSAFKTSDFEMRTDGPAYAVDTLRHISAQYPHSEILYITGTDTVAELMTWKSPEEVIALAQFVAYSRPGFLPEQLLNALPSRYLSRVHVLESINLEISSTNIRKRLSEHKPVRYLIPDAVLEYIERNELYVR